MYNVDQIKKDLKNNLSIKRYEHSIMVAKEAKKLARHYHIDENKAYVAGLVHDIAKEFDNKENAQIITKYHLSNEWLLPKFEKIIHAEIGSYVIRSKYNLDEDICNAVKYHTIGNVSMNLLDKIIFMADKIGRKIKTPTIERQRKLAYKNIDQALIDYLKNQKEQFENTDKELHPDSIELLNYLLNNNS